MLLRIELLSITLTQKVKTAMATSDITSAEKVVGQYIVKFHTFAFQNRENKSHFSNLLLEFIFGGVIANKDHLLRTKVTDSVI